MRPVVCDDLEGCARVGAQLDPLAPCGLDDDLAVGQLRVQTRLHTTRRILIRQPDEGFLRSFHEHAYPRGLGCAVDDPGEVTVLAMRAERLAIAVEGELPILGVPTQSSIPTVCSSTVRAPLNVASGMPQRAFAPGNRRSYEPRSKRSSGRLSPAYVRSQDIVRPPWEMQPRRPRSSRLASPIRTRRPDGENEQSDTGTERFSATFLPVVPSKKTAQSWPTASSGRPRGLKTV
jgi:hypothetical protein